MKLFEKSNKYMYPLVINQFMSQNYKTIVKNSSSTSLLTLYYTDAVLQSIFLGFNILEKNILEFKQPISGDIIESRYFI